MIELLVVMALLLVVMGAIYGVWSGLERTYVFTNEDMAAQTQARAAMGEMVEYIRTARRPDAESDPSLDAVITSAGPQSLTLWTDTVRDGTHDLQLITFRVAPDPLDATRFVLYREQGDDAVRLVSYAVANDAEHPLFTYLNAQDATVNPVAQHSQIRQVVINLRIDVDPSHSPTVNVLTSVVVPRNLRQ